MNSSVLSNEIMKMLFYFIDAIGCILFFKLGDVFPTMGWHPSIICFLLHSILLEIVYRVVAK